MASFHRAARADDRVASFGRFEPVARAVRDVLAQVEPLRCYRPPGRPGPGGWAHGGGPGPPAAAHRGAGGEACRARARRPPLEHVYCFPDRAPPDDLVVIDGVEFSERLRCLDPVADIAFLAMEFALHGRRDLAGAFSRAYLRAAGDAEGERLLPFYSAYRSAVRGAVRGLQSKDEGLSPEARGGPGRRPGPTGCWPSASWSRPAAGRVCCWSAACRGRGNRPWR
ncbi:MAG: hypothetical protein U0797_03420 [Gemmataceae bacterium]